MFYNGGMTLGYLAPAVEKDRKKAKSLKFPSAFTNSAPQHEPVPDQEAEKELARAFITPWHLFY